MSYILNSGTGAKSKQENEEQEDNDKQMRQDLGISHVFPHCIAIEPQHIRIGYRSVPLQILPSSPPAHPQMSNLLCARFSKIRLTFLSKDAVVIFSNKCNLVFAFPLRKGAGVQGMIERIILYRRNNTVLSKSYVSNIIVKTRILNLHMPNWGIFVSFVPRKGN